MQSHTVLLIDDDIDDQEIFSLALFHADKNIKCIFADDGINALEMFNSDVTFQPDYIFIDMNMPRMSGSQCLFEIKKIDRLKEIPVFMYSTSIDPNTVNDNIKLGAKDFITKPSDIKTLTGMLSSILIKGKLALVALFILFSIIPDFLIAQTTQPDTLLKVDKLKLLSVEELTNLIVTSVSRTPENISEVASAIQVIRGEDIERSTVTYLPEALRLATNMQVAQAGSHDWGVTARGFNGFPVSNSTLANKLLVLIDGRTTYTPLFGGVFWDVQNVMLEDINRIEVISGPGGTIWGANAVNGVVNIISKSAQETQGVYTSASLGTFLQDEVAVRYGSHIDSTFFFRVYCQRFDFNSTRFEDGTDARDSWSMNQGGFRADYLHSEKNTFTIQGDVYGGDENNDKSIQVDGQNVILRWTHSTNATSSWIVQYYFDRTYRNIKQQDFRDEMITNDFDFQHNFSLGSKNKIVWGGNYRLANDKISSGENNFMPEERLITLFSGFVQDQITIIPRRLELTVGTKILYNTYSAYEFHPTIRLAYTQNKKNTIWAAVSQAVRTPTRFDVDNVSPSLGSSGDFKSEKVIAYEVGYHMRPLNYLSFSIDAYYNDYRDLRSADTNFTPPPAFYFANNLEASTYGVEFSANADLTHWWKLRGGYSYLHESFNVTSPATFPNTHLLEAIDPQHSFLIQSIMNIGKGLQLDGLLRYVSSLPAAISLPSVDAYFSLNLRIAYRYKSATLAIYGKDLLMDYHKESGLRQVPRNFLGKITFEF